MNAAMGVPRLIQRKRTAGWRLPEGAVCVTRPGKWGNPFQVREPVSRDSELWPYIVGVLPEGVTRGLSAVRLLRVEDVLEAHFRWFVEQPHLMLTVEQELGGKDLACWCKPGRPCHGEFLLGLANGLDMPDEMCR